MKPPLTRLILLAVILAASQGGCSRAFYRRQADSDAYAIVREKATHPHWRLPNYTISVDPRSRMYDPYQIDCPPMPADDPTAHQLMHCVDNKRGWPFWHDNGDRPYVENPAWPEYINIDDRGVLRLDRDDAVRLALLHSREYQQQLETLYLSALDVSVERFNFDAQFFSTYSLFGDWLGPKRTGNSSSILDQDTTFTMRKASTTGSTLVVNFANQLLWQFSGQDNYTPTTAINFSLVQPLLRGAGRDRIMEFLTRAERALLYNVRIMEQYRQAFYVDTVAGGGTQGSTTNRIGGVGGQGLAGFSGIGASGFGNVQTVGGAAGTQAGAAGANNFIGLLQQQRIIRNTEDAIRRLRRNLSRMTTLMIEQPSEQTGAYLTQALQEAQSRQALLRQEIALINQRNQFQQDLDQFKVNELSLPPQICIEPSDSLLDRFELIQQDVIRLPEDWEGILLSHAGVRREIPERIQANVQVVAQPGMLPVCRLVPYEQLDADLAALPPALAEMQQFIGRITNVHLKTIQEDLVRFRQALPQRRERLERLIARLEELRSTPCELLPLGVNPLDYAGGGERATELLNRLDASLANAEKSYVNLSTNFGRYAESLANRSRLAQQLQQNKPASQEELFQQIVQGIFNPNYECGKTSVLTIDVVEEINRDLIELQLLQAIARAEAIELQEVDLRADQSLEVARRYRRDWMNARAALVDSWRVIQFNADRLQSQLDVVFEGDILNVNDNPFSLRADAGRLRAGVRFDAPITRLVERNTYRQNLIEYQQARRNYYRFEDQVAQGLRGRLRSLTGFQINFELNRLAVLEAARQVILNTYIDQDAQQSLTTRVTAARDIVQALTDLLDAQNQFMLVFISYEVQRLQLDFNLGTMQLDDEGLWIDPGRMGSDYGQYDPWAWRAGHEQRLDMHPGEELPLPSGKSPPGMPVPGKATHQGDAVNELPPPFLLPPANGGEASPAAEPVPERTPTRER